MKITNNYEKFSKIFVTWFNSKVYEILGRAFCILQIENLPFFLKFDASHFLNYTFIIISFSV